MSNRQHRRRIYCKIADMSGRFLDAKTERIDAKIAPAYIIGDTFPAVSGGGGGAVLQSARSQLNGSKSPISAI